MKDITLKMYIMCVLYYQCYSMAFDVTQHEKTSLCTQNTVTYSYYSTCLLYCLRSTESVMSIRFPMQICINSVNFIILLQLLIKLFKFVIQKAVKFYVYISPIFSCRFIKYIVLFSRYISTFTASTTTLLSKHVTTEAISGW